MTRLQLCQKLYRILRGGQQKPGVGPVTTLDQEGYELEIVSFIDDAYETIQAEQMEWAFRVKQGTFPLVAATRTYSRATIQNTLVDYDQWLAINGTHGYPHLLIYPTATGVSDSTPCQYVPYEQFRGWLDVGTRPTGKPSYFTEKPDRTLEFDATPDAAYTVALDYRRTLHVMTTDSDATTGTPIIPADFHNAIVYQAAESYIDGREVSAQMERRIRSNARREMLRLRTAQLPDVSMRLDHFYNPA